MGHGGKGIGLAQAAQGQKPLGEADACQPFLPQAMLRGRSRWPLTPWVSVCFDHSAWVPQRLSMMQYGSPLVLSTGDNMEPWVGDRSQSSLQNL